MKRHDLLAVGIIAVTVIMSLYFYRMLPEKMVSHWNFNDQPDDSMPKPWALLIAPASSLFVYLLFKLVPRIDPLKANIKKFQQYYETFILIVLFILFYTQSIMILWNLGMRFSVQQAIIPPISLLFFYIGVMLKKSKRNWFIGVRNPWTLSSDSVWDKVNKRGGIIFKLSAIALLLVPFLPGYGFILVIAFPLAGSVYLTAYSYFEYKRQKG
ncbi:hypothetical protein A3K63_03420 [Candidatus Micrarchaeota archaeon RBG_16_49_10]|nr:MAG: hypothetical protein A3K63_03420 [Candidatus Micrarchaeota archaeon RBG_16_49_10]